MSMANKRFFWITASILFTLAMIFTFMPLTAHAATTDALDPSIANQVIRVDELPTAGADYVGKYYDVDGKVYYCTAPSSDYFAIYNGLTFGSEKLMAIAPFPYDMIISDSSYYVSIIKHSIYGTLYCMAEVSGSYYICCDSSNLYLIYSNGSTQTIVNYVNHNNASTSTVFLSVPECETITAVPSNTEYLECLMYSTSAYQWTLLHEHNLVEYTLEEATCTTPGSKAIGCSYCEVLNIYGEETEIPATGHNWVEMTSKGDCETVTVTYYCAGCQQSKTETEEGPGHDYSSTFTPGTDTTLGYYTYTCSKCSDTYTVNESWDCDTDGHKGEETGRTGGTCTEDLVITYECTVCSGTYTETTEAPGHNWVEQNSKGDCVTVTKTYFCSVCGQTKTENIPGPGHDYSSTFTPGTDTTLGYYTYTCSKCSDTYTVSESWDCDTDGHKGEETGRTGGTCTEDLVITYECTVCSGTYTETTEAPGHNWLITEKGDCTGVTIIKSCTVCSVTETSTGEPKSHNLVSTRHEATDISVGYTEFTCSTCGYSYNVYDAHDCATQGHIGPETDRVRSCTELTIYCVCSVCEESFSLVDDTGGLGHDLVETSSSGLCTSRSVTYSCQRSGCDHTETRTEVRSHSYVQTDWQGPCDQAVVTYTCSTCGDSYTESSPGSHAYEETARTDATCTAEGSITYTCSSCNATKLEAIPILEHDMQLVGFETSCTERTDTYECSMCGYTEQRAGTPLGHSWTITNTTEDGYRIKTYTCQICGHVEEERTALPKVPETTVEDVERFVLNFFGSIASFFLYILANISFLGITGLDLLAILAIVAFVVLIRKITSGGD